MDNPFEGEFMQPEIVYDAFFHVETTHGTELVPEDCDPKAKVASDLTDYLEGMPYDEQPIELKRGFYARLSASGYTDCTCWYGPFDTEAEAMADLADTYGE